MDKKRIYMDHAATTPLDPLVLEAMLPFFSEKYGNPSSLYTEGREAGDALEMAREQLAKGIGAKPDEVIFTSGGTESDNLALKGVSLSREKKSGHIITATIEHPAILKACQYLESFGFKVTYLPVDKYGSIQLDMLKKAFKKDTFIVSIGMANNEIGTIQDIKEISKLVHEHGAVLHTDAVQAIGKTPVDVNDLGVDLLSISAHKIYGPKGAGGLYVRKGVKMTPVQHGGGHERGQRSGTENVSGIIGLAKAMQLADQRLPTDIPRIQALRDRLIKEVLSGIDNSYLNGHPEKRLANNAHFRFSFIEGEAIILNLDFMGISASTGSACSSKSLKASHVLLAIGLKPEEAHGSLRLTLGRNNTAEEVSQVIDSIKSVVEKLRKMSPLGAKPGKE
jgi:cysteine desulfurase